DTLGNLRCPSDRRDVRGPEYLDGAAAIAGPHEFAVRAGPGPRLRPPAAQRGSRRTAAGVGVSFRLRPRTGARRTCRRRTFPGRAANAVRARERSRVEDLDRLLPDGAGEQCVLVRGLSAG